MGFRNRKYWNITRLVLTGKMGNQIDIWWLITPLYSGLAICGGRVPLFWIASRCFFTSYHDKSPLNHHVGEYFITVSKHQTIANPDHNQLKFQVPKIKVLNLIRLYWGWGFLYIALTYSLYRCVPPFLGTWNVWWYNIYTSTQGMREVALAPPRCCAHGGRGCEDNNTLKLAREVHEDCYTPVN